MIFFKKQIAGEKEIVITEKFLDRFSFYEKDDPVITIANIIRIIRGLGYINFDFSENTTLVNSLGEPKFDHFGYEENGLNWSCSTKYSGLYCERIKPFGLIKPFENISYYEWKKKRSPEENIFLAGNCFETANMVTYLMNAAVNKYDIPAVNYELLFKYKKSFHVKLNIDINNISYIFDAKEDEFYFFEQQNANTTRRYEYLTIEKEELSYFEEYFNAYILYNQGKYQDALNNLEELYLNYKTDFVLLLMDKINKNYKLF